MNFSVEKMLNRFDLKSGEDYREALRKIIQEIALLGLGRSKFFEHAAFYGGTCLRILYGLERFSENLDFSLLKPNSNFDWTKYNRAVQTELESYGFETSILTKEKLSETSILSTFIKTGTYMQILKIEPSQALENQMQKGTVLKIKNGGGYQSPSGLSNRVKIYIGTSPIFYFNLQASRLVCWKNACHIMSKIEDTC